MLMFLGVFRQMLDNKWLNEMIKEACQVVLTLLTEYKKHCYLLFIPNP